MILRKLSKVNFNWTTSVYGHGNYIKKFLMWPTWLPLPAYISHGVNTSPFFSPHELKSKFLVNLYYSDTKVLWQINSPFQIFIQVPHPYLILQREHFPLPSPNRKGLVVFWPHTTSSVQYSKNYVIKYLEFLESLESNFDSIDVCISSNDLAQPWLPLISQYFNIVTAGSSLDLEFPKKLFALIDTYEFATSPLGGSELFYCHLMGVKYFIEGPMPPYYNANDPNLLLGQYSIDSLSGFQKFEELHKIKIFSRSNIESLYEEKNHFVKKYLGFNAKVNKPFLILLLLLDLPRHIIGLLFRVVRKIAKLVIHNLWSKDRTH